MRIKNFLFFTLIGLAVSGPCFAQEMKPVWTIQDIPANVAERIKGSSWKEGCPVPIEGLAYLQLSYWGFDDRVHHDGELIVNRDVAEEVLAIFKDLYKHQFPIEKIRLIDDYGGRDDPSMEDNNTSAFNCRPITGASAGFSLHSYGTAIDINPRINPYVKIVDGVRTISPTNGEMFADRNSGHKGMIKEGNENPCYKAFVKRGWTWGGTKSWLSKRCNLDYQHFQKQPAEQKPECK